MTGKRLIIVGADYSDVSIGKLKISITSTKLSDGETATLTLSAPSVTATTLKAETSGSTITMTGSNPYTITAGSTDGTQEITCTLTYTDTTGKSVTETKKLTITVGGTTPVPSSDVWYSNRVAEAVEQKGTANYCMRMTDGADDSTIVNGVKINRARFKTYSYTGDITFSLVILNESLNSIVATYTSTVPAVSGEVTEVTFPETHTIVDNQKVAFWYNRDLWYNREVSPAQVIGLSLSATPSKGESITMHSFGTGQHFIDFGYKE